MATYTVKKGDTLSGIAQANLSTIGASSIYGSGGGVELLCAWNNIKNQNYIVVGQVLQISNPGSSGTTSAPKNNSNQARINLFGLQSNTENTIYCSWTWDKANTENYEYIWYYDTGDGIWFVGSKSTTEVEVPQCTYSAPSNANRVKFKIRPVSKKYKSNDQEVSYWTADWSTEQVYNMSDTPPKKPSTPNLESDTNDKYTLIASLDNIDTGKDGINATHIYFEVVKDNASIYAICTAEIKMGHAEYTFKVPAGGEYKVRCYSVRGNLRSAWSEYSSSTKGPPASTKIVRLTAASAASIYIEWEKQTTADSYEIQFAKRSDIFSGSNTDFAGSDQVQSFTADTNHYIKDSGLESGNEYFFRVKCVNTAGSSAWSEVKSIVIGKAPTAPTTWSSSTSVVSGDPLNLYWVHNSRDGSSQVAAVLYLCIDGEEQEITVNNNRSEEEKDKTSVYEFATTGYSEGTQVQWKVKTRGVTGEYSEWSVERTVDIYGPPHMSLNVKDTNAETITMLTSFPFYVEATPYPATQTPTGYHLSVTANEPYETVDQYGNVKMVNEGEDVYAKQFNTSANLLVILSAENITLANNVTYTIACTVALNSGLTAEASTTFKVAWTDNEYVPNAEISVNKTDFTTYIHPYVVDENEELIDGVLLSVYRREYNGEFTELIKDIKNTSNTFITDPHPALDFARYRIVAKTTATGKVSFTDLPGYPVGGTDVIIQWNEDWSTFDSPEGEGLEHPEWTGSMLKLKYNIDTTEKNKHDVELVEYVGRSHPTSYYGTHQGTTATWNVVIEKSDTETLYTLRRLQQYMGDVYVREPSGIGYWANITVSLSQKHCEMTIPVTLEIARVEGGA